MEWTDNVRQALGIFCFSYPFIVAWYWMAGGLLHTWFRERHEPAPDSPTPLPSYPMVSILVPCHNEEHQAIETFGALAHVEYPNYEIVAINDGSRDRTAEILDGLASRIPRLRVVHLTRNQGKARALNVGAMLAQGELLVCIDGDALLDPHAVTWFVRRMQSDGRLGGVTGNPRLRNRSSLLGRMQVGEYSSIVGLIKRANTVMGWVFTVSGVICCFRRRALQDIGWWSSESLTDDVDVTWRLQLAGWHISYEPKALCWILMPETLRGLWRQRVRWSEGGTQAILTSTKLLFSAGRWPAYLVWTNYLIGIAWAYLISLSLLATALRLAGLPYPAILPTAGIMPGWSGVVLPVTYLAQSSVGILLDLRYETRDRNVEFCLIWYPLLFWVLQAATAVVGLPRAVWRIYHPGGTWISPDRGIR